MAMLRLDDPGELRRRISAYGHAGERVALVPTMGNLHAGHLALIDLARERADRVVASIFVNPTQFGPGEDFDAYPRTEAADLAALAERGCDLAWCPAVATMYPLPESFTISPPPSLAELLCGRDRPGHFDGVASVVLRLFNQVRPDVAIFGEKDFQQLLIIRRLAEDLALPVDVVAAPTRRERDGLAMSSRNQYLDADQRARAPRLYQALNEGARELVAGADWASVRARAWQVLIDAGFEPQYLEWRSHHDLTETRQPGAGRLFAAARLGRARLIDNLAVSK